MAEDATSSGGSLHFGCLFDCQLESEHSNADPVHEVVAVGVTSKPEKQTEKHESAHSKTHFCSACVLEDHTHGEESCVEAEENPHEQTISHSSVFLEILAVFLFKLLFFGYMSLDVFLGFTRVSLLEMFLSSGWVELKQTRIALDFVLSVLHFFNFVEIVLQSSASGPSAYFSSALRNRRLQGRFINVHKVSKHLLVI